MTTRETRTEFTRCPACGFGNLGWHYRCVQRVFEVSEGAGVSTEAIADALGVALDELRERGLWPIEVHVTGRGPHVIAGSLPPNAFDPPDQ